MQTSLKTLYASIKLLCTLLIISSGLSYNISYAASPIIDDRITVKPCEEGRGILIELPVIESYEDIRKQVAWQAPGAISKNGKIVVYNDYLLVNEPDKGIHVFDNTIPENPTAIGFIKVPGNTDLMVRNDVLYADSFVDLVLIDISNMETVEEIGRSLDIYQANPYRFVRNLPRTFQFDENKELITGIQNVCVSY